MQAAFLDFGHEGCMAFNGKIGFRPGIDFQDYNYRFGDLCSTVYDQGGRSHLDFFALRGNSCSLFESCISA